MESWAAGHALSQTLRMALLSYQWCKLDDTWDEASHRDASRDGSRRSHASQAWISVTLRLQQNLSLWDSFQTATRCRMDGMFKRWTAIGQVEPRRTLALIPRKQPPKVVLQFVYRSGKHALENWGRKLKEALQIDTHGDAIQRIAFAGRLRVDF